MRNSQNKLTGLFNLNKPFHKNALTQIVFYIGAIITVVSAVSIIVTDFRPICGTAECFKTFLELASFPIKAAAATIALLAILLSIYRAELTQVQIAHSERVIKVSQDQNITINHYKHLDDFLEFFDETMKNSSFSNLITRMLHKHLFPGSEAGNRDLSKSVKDDFEQQIAALSGAVHKLRASSNHSEIELNLYRLYVIFSNIGTEFKLGLKAGPDERIRVRGLEPRDVTVNDKEIWIANFLLTVQEQLLSLMTILSYQDEIDDLKPRIAKVSDEISEMVEEVEGRRLFQTNRTLKLSRLFNRSDFDHYRR